MRKLTSAENTAASLAVAPATAPAFVEYVGPTFNPYMDGLLSGSKWSQSAPLTYSFPTSTTAYETGTPETASGFAPVSSNLAQAVRLVLEGSTPLSGGLPAMRGMGVEQLTNLEFTNVTGTSDLRFARSDLPTTAYAYYPAGGDGGDIWYGPAYSGTSNDYQAPSLGNYALFTTIHEIGHAVGLKHANEQGGVSDVAVPADQDWLQYTLMSYRSYPGSSTDGLKTGPWDMPQTFMPLDIAALQKMYGADFTDNGPDVYTWNPNTGEMLVDGVGQGAPGGGISGVANRIFMTLWPRGGHETMDLSNYGGSVSVDLNPGKGTITSKAQLAFLGDGNTAKYNIANALLYNGNLASLIEDARGGGGADTIVGNQINNMLSGNGGNDTIGGGAGNDTLDGGSGDDSTTGGQGNDLHIARAAGDVVVENANEGTDTVQASISYTLGTSVENLTLTGTAANGYGNGLANTLTGNASANLLVGAGGADRMVGGAGNDTYDVENTGDVVVEIAGQGTDTIRTYLMSYTAGESIENLALMGSATTGIGNGAANNIAGNSANNVIRGMGGKDVLTGGGGADRFDWDRLVDSTAAARDLITDFRCGTDKLDFSGIDANVGLSGDQAFRFVGTGPFAGGGNGSLRWFQDTGNACTYVELDAGNGGVAETMVKLSGVLPLLSSDFIF